MNENTNQDDFLRQGAIITDLSVVARATKENRSHPSCHGYTVPHLVPSFLTFILWLLYNDLLFQYFF